MTRTCMVFKEGVIQAYSILQRLHTSTYLSIFKLWKFSRAARQGSLGSERGDMIVGSGVRDASARCMIDADYDQDVKSTDCDPSDKLQHPLRNMESRTFSSEVGTGFDDRQRHKKLGSWRAMYALSSLMNHHERTLDRFHRSLLECLGHAYKQSQVHAL